MDINRLTVHVKTEDFYEDIAKDVEKRFDTSNYVLERPLLKRENKRVIGLRKAELGGKIMKEFLGLREKTYSYLRDANKKVKGTKNVQYKNLHLNIKKIVKKQLSLK